MADIETVWRDPEDSRLKQDGQHFAVTWGKQFYCLGPHGIQPQNPGIFDLPIISDLTVRIYRSSLPASGKSEAILASTSAIDGELSPSSFCLPTGLTKSVHASDGRPFSGIGPTSLVKTGNQTNDPSGECDILTAKCTEVSEKHPR